MRINTFEAFGLLCLMLFQACQHAPEAVNFEVPGKLVYSPNSIEIIEGNTGHSGIPSIEGTFPINFSLTTTPATYNAVTISPEGVIQVNEQLNAGSYKVHVHADNAAGATVFPEAFSIQVTKPLAAPTGLVYSPNKIELLAGTATSSAIPSIQGTSPITYALQVTPDALGNITIDEAGAIMAHAGLAPGTYTIDVTATNALGSQLFSGAYTITANLIATAPAELTYSPNSLLMNSGSTASSAVPSIKGTSPMTFTLSATPDAAGNISIDNQGVISASDQLAPNSYSITVTASNAAGSTTFNEVYQITAQEQVYVTFTKDIKPIITNHCSTCHTTGPQTIYTDYTNAKTNINLILDRIQRTEKSAGFMPKNGTKLSDAQIALFQQWLTDGLKEN